MMTVFLLFTGLTNKLNVSGKVRHQVLFVLVFWNDIVSISVKPRLLPQSSQILLIVLLSRYFLLTWPQRVKIDLGENRSPTRGSGGVSRSREALRLRSFNLHHFHYHGSPHKLWRRSTLLVSLEFNAPTALSSG